VDIYESKTGTKTLKIFKAIEEYVNCGRQNYNLTGIIQSSGFIIHQLIYIFL